MATFARFLFLYSLVGFLASAVCASLGAMQLVSPEGIALLLLLAVVFGQFSAILIGNWSLMARIRKFGFWNALVKPASTSHVWRQFRLAAMDCGIWGWLKAGMVLLGTSMAWTAVRLATASPDYPGPGRTPFFAWFCGVFFLAHALIAVEALVNRGSIKDQSSGSHSREE